MMEKNYANAMTWDGARLRMGRIVFLEIVSAATGNDAPLVLGPFMFPWISGHDVLQLMVGRRTELCLGAS